MEQKNSVGGESEAFFEVPTPGAPNNSGKLPPAYVTVDTPTKAFASGAVVVTVTADHPEATIRYTIDGSEPTKGISFPNVWTLGDSSARSYTFYRS